MAAELFSPPSKALDANANPYAGAIWYFYESETTTPQEVYADAALTTSLGSAVTADSAGKFPNIYFNSALEYRGVLKNADGSVTLHDIDPINLGMQNDFSRALTGAYGFQPWNSYTITSDDANVAFSIDNYLLHYFGGEAARGSRAGDFAHLVQTAATGGTGVNFYTGSQGVIQTNSGDGGTDTGAGARGGYYGINPIAKAQGSNLYAVSPAELDLMVKSGTTARHLFGLAVADFAAAHGVVTDAAIIVYSGGEQGANLGGGPWGPGLGRKNGLLFAELESNGLVPLHSSATVLGGSVTSLANIPVTHGVDLRNFDISGLAFAAAGFLVDGQTGGTSTTLGNATPDAWFSAQQGGNQSLDASKNSILVDVAQTIHQVNALSAFVQSNRAQPVSGGGDVAAYFQAGSAANNSAVFPINALAYDDGTKTGQTMGIELDYNVSAAGTTVNGINLLIVSTSGGVLSGDRNAVAIRGAFHATSTWSNGLVTENGAIDLYAGFLGSQTAVAGTNRNSQKIGLVSYNSSDTRFIAEIFGDSSGGLALRPGSSSAAIALQSNAGDNWAFISSTGLHLMLSSSVTPTTNGEMAIQATSDTSLTFKYKGSDGTVRSGSVALS